MKPSSTYTRSTKLSLKFLNPQKRKELEEVLEEYTRLTQKFVEKFWLDPNRDKLPKHFKAEVYNTFPSFLGGYAKQCACGQAAGIAKTVSKKIQKKQWTLKECKKAGRYKKAEKLRKEINTLNNSCPRVEHLEMVLGHHNQLVRFETESKTKDFDTWLYLSLSKDCLNKTYIPLKKTKHFNTLLKKGGKLKGSVRISKDFVTVFFDFPKETKEKGATLGIDIGIKNILSCSNGFQTKGLDHIQAKIARKKKGSKAFARAQQERTNFINWSINQLNLQGISLVKREDIKNIRLHKRSSRYMQSWTYTDIVGKLDRYCEEQNVSILVVPPAFTSQRCSQCGFVHRSSRNGKTFICTNCGFTLDADLNASRNIGANLSPVSGERKRLSSVGFFWLEKGQECIVPATERNKR